jgi:CheY-like chemotaxis protein
MSKPPILLVDDNRAWLESLADYLRSKGFTVQTASSASQGLGLMETQDFSLVVCDYQMPGMSGLDLARHLHRHRRDVAILMITSADESGLAARARAAGVRELLAKTTAPGILLRKVTQLVDTVVAAATRPVWQRLLPSPNHVARARNGQRGIRSTRT